LDAEALDPLGETGQAVEIVGEAQLDRTGHDFVRGLPDLARGPSVWIACSTLRKMRSGCSTSWIRKRVSASWARTDSSRAIANTMSCAWHSLIRLTSTRAAV